MDTFSVSITDLKQNTSEIINRVVFEKKEAVIKRHGKVVVHIVRPKTTTPKIDLAKALKETFGAIPDFPDVKKSRYFSGRRFKGL